MGKRILLFILALASLVFYFMAPTSYELSYTIECTIVFVLSSIVLISNNCKKSAIKFELFFLIAFFFSNYVYSIIYYPVNPYISHFSLSFNENYISKGLGLSTVAACCFNFGICERDPLSLSKELIWPDRYKSPKAVTLILMLLFLPSLYGIFRTGEYSTEFEHSLVNAILVYFLYFSIFYVFYYAKNYSTLSSLWKKQRTDYFTYILLLYVILFLLIGSRTIPLRVVLLMVFLYTVYIKPIGPLKVIALFIVGALVMTYVGMVREGGEFNTSSLTSVFDLGMDLTINNRSLYVLMEYADTNGYTYGRTLLMSILSVIPFAQSIFLSVTGWRTSDISSANLVTDLYYDYTNEKSIGLGTNVVGDIYVSFGLIGVIIMMYLLGHILVILYKKSSQGNNFAILLYGLIFMDAIYYPRSTIFTSLRPLAWVFVIYMIFRVSRASSVKKRES